MDLNAALQKILTVINEAKLTAAERQDVTRAVEMLVNTINAQNKQLTELRKRAEKDQEADATPDPTGGSSSGEGD